MAGLRLLKDLVNAVKLVPCIVCYEDMELEPSGFDPPTPACNHDRNICDNCLRMTYETNIGSGAVGDLECPDPDCRKPVSSELLESLVSNRLFRL